MSRWILKTRATQLGQVQKQNHYLVTAKMDKVAGWSMKQAKFALYPVPSPANVPSPSPPFLQSSQTTTTTTKTKNSLHLSCTLVSILINP